MTELAVGPEQVSSAHPGGVDLLRQACAPHLEESRQWAIVDVTPGPEHVAAIALGHASIEMSLTRVLVP